MGNNRKDSSNYDNIVSLRVAEAEQTDVGRKIARLDPEIAHKLKLSAGDALEISSMGKKTTVLSWPAREKDSGKGLVRIDGYLRNKLDVGINDSVEIKKVESKSAHNVRLAPTEPLRIVGAESYLKEYLLGSLLSTGDILPLSIMGQRVDLVVISTKPSGPVLIEDSTELTVSEESQKAVQVAKEGGTPSISYEDIGGIKNAVSRLREMIELPLRHPELFKRLGVEAPKGVLLHGPPGTGKTLLAKAVAHETNANFYTIGGPEIMSKYYGESEERLREIFKNAEEKAPAIIFIDEIDSIAPKREEVSGEVERRVVAQLLSLMDGMSSRGKVVVIGATNRVNIRALRKVLPEIDLTAENIPSDTLKKIVVTMDDFLNVIKEIEPSALREVFVEVPNVNWNDIGGLADVKQELQEAVEWPLKYHGLFVHSDAIPPKGILLYGPPGTGKTLIAKAAAHESEANFISIKGPELLSKWVGESEKGVREIFRKARQAAPCIVFFDEVDAIAPTRGALGSDSHVTERVISQLLTELDGLEVLSNVIIIAATNRPDIIDAALLRPGRFDRLLYVPPPDKESRIQIFKIHTSKKPLAADINIEALAGHTEGYTGADIAALASAAVMLALREHIEKYKDPKKADEAKDELKIHMKNFEEAMKKIRPLSKHEIESYKNIAEQFGKPNMTKEVIDKETAIK